MKNISSICVNPRITTLCIGKFDGVHLAHQKLLSCLSLESGGVLVIKTHSFPLLTPNLADLIPFALFEVELESIREQNNQEFIAFLKEYFPSLKKIVVGYDFRYGKNRLYSPKDLESYFEVCVIDEVRYQGIAIHKKVICEFLLKGEIQKANAMLGRFYTIHGEVIRGQGRGRKECVPTLNLCVRDYILPKSGVYLTYAEIGGARKWSLSFLGHRLSADGEFAIETHLLEDLPCSPQEIKITFLEFLRENQKFSSLALLKRQIQEDILRAKSLIAKGTIP